jgi:TolB-like protein/class 3 adenylate cyclase/tetratricopeptide (TPR) repeat protein
LDPPEVERKLAAILSADVVGYSRLMAEDEAATVRTLTAYRDEIALLTQQHRGRVVDAPGDNVLAEFPTATDAVRCAVEIQGVLRVRNAALPAERKMEFRIGVHLGEVRVEGERIYGDGVNIAARLEGLAEPAGICVSRTVHEQIRHQLDLTYTDLGDQEVKNIPEPVRAYQVGTAGPAPVSGLQRRSASRVLMTLFVVLLAALAGALVWRYLASFMGDDKAAGISGPPSAVAVLPFVNMSEDPAQEYFADGISEELINALTKIPGLRVAARTSAFAFKGRNEDIRTIGSQLNVGAVVEGSVRKAGNRVRITAQLVRVSDGFHIWSETYDRKLDDVFAIQDEIARATVSALEVQLASTERLVKRPTPSLRAYEHYLTGRHFWNQRTEEGLRKAIRYFEDALEADPNYALAYAGLADSYMLLWNYRHETREVALRKAEPAAIRAVAIDESSAEAHVSLGAVRRYQWKWKEAERETRRALELNPGYATGHHWYSWSMATVGRRREGLAAIQRALELDPLSPTINRDAGWHYVYAGDHEAAIHRARRALELNPNDPHAPSLLARAYLAQGREPEVLELFQGDGSEAETQAELRSAYKRGGPSAVYRRSLELRIAQTKKQCTEWPYWAAAYLAVLGEADRMFECLREAVHQRRPMYPLSDPVFEPHRSDPRFVAILDQMGLKGRIHEE